MESFIFIRVSSTKNTQQILEEYKDFLSESQEQYLPSDMSINDVFTSIYQTPDNLQAWNIAKENYVRVFGNNPPNNVMKFQKYQ